MVPYVYRQPHDYRAPDHNRRLLYQQASTEGTQVVTYRGPPRLIYSKGVFRQDYTVVPGERFHPPITQDPGGSTSLTFAASGTLIGELDPTGVVVAFSRVLKERGQWQRQPYDETPIRSLNPLYTSWQPTGASLLKFTPTGELLATLQGSATTSLSFTVTGAAAPSGNLIGTSSLTFHATGNTDGSTLIAGTATLSFVPSASISLVGFISGSSSISFEVASNFLPAAIEGSASLRFTTLGDAVLIFPPTQEIVPYLIGYTQEPAETAIEQIHCVASVVGSTGTVTAQDPVAFSLVDRGTTITITLGGAVNSVSKGKRRGQQPYNTRH